MGDGLRTVPALAAGRPWDRVFEQRQARADAEGLITWDVSVDSIIAGGTPPSPLPRSAGGSATSV
ncbi:hypothetical protein [Streptomyces phaeochromogenes]|uniref:hypothetical protein n=1 Tax=Streptomyces phaeochromogenes TaxID=1923 RepID=UPI00386F8D75|nr:hypothetical protein OG277_37840 [Streptomyces phaeochromogenes]